MIVGKCVENWELKAHGKDKFCTSYSHTATE